MVERTKTEEKCKEKIGYEIVASFYSAWIIADILLLRSHILTVIPTLVIAKVLDGLIYMRNVSTCEAKVDAGNVCMYCFVKIIECLPLLVAVYLIVHVELKLHLASTERDESQAATSELKEIQQDPMVICTMASEPTLIFAN